MTATLLDVAGVDPGDIDGHPVDRLIERGGREYVFAERGVRRRQGDIGEVHSPPPARRAVHELYDLESDPEEFHDVSDRRSHRDSLAEVRRVLLGRYLDGAMPYYQRPTDI